MNAEVLDRLRIAIEDPGAFSRDLIRRPLRPYQIDAARAIARAAIEGPRDVVSVMMARQAGKNELSAHVEAYLLTVYSQRGGNIVKAAPTFKPQLVTSMLRLRNTLGSPLLPRLTSSYGYKLGLGKATCTFLSAEPNANVVGETASIALEFDEAQNIDQTKHDLEFRPMAASTNAPTIYYGTAWTDSDLLQVAKQQALELQARDGVRRHFEYDWEYIAEWNPAYGEYVRAERRRLGEDHPTFKTQYRLIPVATIDRLLTEKQIELLRGDHFRHDAPIPGRVYVAGIDLGGTAEIDPKELGASREHDSTVLTIGEVALDGVLPSVRVVRHFVWTGAPHEEQNEKLVSAIEHWRCQRVAVDATGLGIPTAAFLLRRFGEDRVYPFKFSQTSKTELGFNLLAWINRGHLRHYAEDPNDDHYALFFDQARAIKRQMKPNTAMTWGNPSGHDDLVISTALCGHAALESPAPAEATTIAANNAVAYEDKGVFA